MYFPYLRGRQFELIALREFVQEYKDNSKITPIIEPVKNTFNSMKIALNIFNKCNQKYALILNPQVGDLSNELSRITEQLEIELKDTSNWIPAFIVTDNYAGVTNLAKEYKDIMLICTKYVDSNNPEFQSLITSDSVKYIVFEEDRTIKRFLRGKGKKLIRLDDNFDPLRRSKDYLTQKEEKFTEEHIYFREDGFYGFSDYTTLSSEFRVGGSLPYAVAIHLTYIHQDFQIWIRHFTSETNDDQSNIQGKFSEAAKKAVDFFESINYTNNSISKLIEIYADKKYPGLGTVKKLSIKNYLELVNRYLIDMD